MLVGIFSPLRGDIQQKSNRTIVNQSNKNPIRLGALYMVFVSFFILTKMAFSFRVYFFRRPNRSGPNRMVVCDCEVWELEDKLNELKESLNK
jgi:hypothetical protein